MADTARAAPATAPFLLDVETIEGARCARVLIEDGPFRLGLQAIECGASSGHWVVVARDFIGCAEVMHQALEFAGDLEQLRRHLAEMADRWQLDPTFVFDNPKVRA